MNQNNNVALIGVGPHSRRIYIPFLKKLENSPKLIIDLKTKEKEVRELFQNGETFYFI